MATDYVPDGRPIVTRVEAKARGLKRFFTGVPCKLGHISERRLSDGTCLECGAIQRHIWKAYNRERLNAAEREANKRNPDAAKARTERYRNTPHGKAKRDAYYVSHQEKIKARSKEWKEANPDRSVELQKAHYEKNKEVIKRRVQEWNAANPEATRARGRNYRARLYAAEGSHTGDEIKALFDKQRGRCGYCRAKLGSGYHADHIKPLFRGGSNRIGNIQLLCQPCNNRKRATDPVEYARRIGLLL